jgi:DNA-binding Lrp family transcriptional regulator
MRQQVPTGTSDLKQDWLERAQNLSDFDRDLIRILQSDGRKSYTRIARELSKTEKQVRRRVSELRDDGVIKITTIATPKLMGYEVLCMVGVTIDPSCGISQTTSQLATVTGAFYVASVTGRYNAIAEISAPNMERLLQILDDEISAIPGILAIETHLYLHSPYQDPAFGGSGTYKQRMVRDDTRHPVVIDAMDREIISKLHDDGRTTYQAIASELSVSEAQIRLRVKRLIESNSVRIMALTTPEALGFKAMAFMAISLSSNTSAEQLAETLSNLESVIYVAIGAGRFDLFVEAACEDQDQLFQFIENRIRPIHGIETVESWNYLRLHYRSVAPATTDE